MTVPELGCSAGTLNRDCPRAQLWYNRPVPSLRLLLALVVSGAVILSSPFIRDIRDWIRATFPGQYATVVATAVALAIGAALVVALVRIRDRRALRYGAIAAALVLGTAYALWNAQGIPEVDAVERVHFVEYGLITLLFYRVWRPRGDVSMFVLPMLAGIAVGTLEEWLQWFIPGRVGDMRDVFLNVVAIVCGLLFSVGVDPPDAGAFQPSSRARCAGSAWSLRPSRCSSRRLSTRCTSASKSAIRTPGGSARVTTPRRSSASVRIGSWSGRTSLRSSGRAAAAAKIST